jgi:protein gp37
MSQKTAIQWTDATWNPTRGCLRISEGCRNCYAERVAARFSKPGMPFDGFAILAPQGPRWTGKVALVESKLHEPMSWRAGRRVFVDSMSDLFHEHLDVADLLRIFCVMQEAEQHDYQILTKRADRMLFLMPWMRRALAEDYERWNGGRFQWPIPNLWLGVSVENRETKHRIDALRKTPAAVRFLSIEPLLEDIGELNLEGIHWVIVGGESGPGARPFHADWAYSIIQQCRDAGVACFVKQLGAWVRWNRDQPSRVLADPKGGDWDEWPASLRVREFPASKAVPE